jgi:hypothetical protein
MSIGFFKKSCCTVFGELVQNSQNLMCTQKEKINGNLSNIFDCMGDCLHDCRCPNVYIGMFARLGIRMYIMSNEFETA